jgi:hypothetical protein
MVLHYLTYGYNPFNDDNESGAVIEKDNQVFNTDQVKEVDVSNIASILEMVGRLRFDTIFVRNIIFIINLYRSVRLKLSEDLTYSKDIVLKSALYRSVRLKLSEDLTYSKDIVLKSAPITRFQSTEFSGNLIDRPRLEYSNDPRFKRYAY